MNRTLLLVLLLAPIGPAAEDDVATRLAPQHKKLTSPKEKTRESAYETYLAEGDEGCTLLRDALLKLRDDRIALCGAFAVSGGARKTLMAAHTELDAARKEALRVIFDSKIYPDANHGRAGQPVVDKAVDAAKKAVKKHQAAFGWALGPSRRGLVMLHSQKSPIRAFRRILAVRERLAETHEVLFKLDAVETGSLPTVADLLEGRVHPDLIAALIELSDAHDCAERCLRYNTLVKTSTTAAERIVLDLTNEYRIQLGVKPLAINEPLVLAARGHSDEMRRLGYFGHTSPVAGRKSFGQRCAIEGYRHARGENCMSGGGAEGAYRAWYNSSGHHRNMLSPGSNEIGIGQAGKWTEDFGSRPDLDLDNPPKSWPSPTQRES
ncbi:CAP domain-containing protein [bacterium]|nr:CAP domain-containing protein [bacterium]